MQMQGPRMERGSQRTAFNCCLLLHHRGHIIQTQLEANKSSQLLYSVDKCDCYPLPPRFYTLESKVKIYCDDFLCPVNTDLVFWVTKYSVVALCV